MISTRMFFGIVVLFISVVSSNDYVETTGMCMPQDGSYVGLGDFGMTLHQCRSWCDAVPSCTGFYYSNLKGPQHSTWSHRCIAFQVSRGCNQQEQQAAVKSYRDRKLDCCLDMSCPNNQYLSGAVGASKYNWICMNTWISKAAQTQKPTMQPTAFPTLNPTSNPSLNPSSSPTLTPTTNPSKRPTAEDFIVKVKAFHGEPKDILDASKFQDQPEVDAEIFGFEHELTPLTRRLLNRFYDLEEQGFGREDDFEEGEFA